MRNGLSVLQWALALLGVLTFGSCAGMLLVLALANDMPMEVSLAVTPAGLFSWGLSLLALGALLAPSVSLAWRRMQSHSAALSAVTVRESLLAAPAPLWKEWWPWLAMLTLFPLALLVGGQVTGIHALDLVLPGLAHLAAIFLPAFWLVFVATRRLPVGSPQRYWGLLGSSMTLSTSLVVVVELTIMGAAFIFGIVILAGRPDWLLEMEDLSQRLAFSVGSEPAMRRILEPYLLNPGLIFSLASFLMVIAPLVEEAMKPLGLWLLAGRRPGPAQGFAAGALCGAGFAIAESLFMPVGEGWAALAIGRVGTASMHVLASAIMGWGLALAWQEGRYLRLGVHYLGALLLHAVWNGLALVNIYATLMPDWRLAGVSWSILANSGLGILAVSNVILLAVLNHRLGAQEAANAAEAPLYATLQTEENTEHGNHHPTD